MQTLEFTPHFDQRIAADAPDAVSAIAPISALANERLAREAAPEQERILALMRQRLGSAGDLIVQRRYRDAKHYAAEFLGAVDSVRHQHADRTERASNLLDGLIQSARSATQSLATDLDDPDGKLVAKESWLLTASKLRVRLEEDAAAFLAGRCGRLEFMADASDLVGEVIRELGRGLSQSAGIPISQLDRLGDLVGPSPSVVDSNASPMQPQTQPWQASQPIRRQTD